jgi:hypothetical protein
VAIARSIPRHGPWAERCCLVDWAQLREINQGHSAGQSSLQGDERFVTLKLLAAGIRGARRTLRSWPCGQSCHALGPRRRRRRRRRIFTSLKSLWRQSMPSKSERCEDAIRLVRMVNQMDCYKQPTTIQGVGELWNAVTKMQAPGASGSVAGHLFHHPDKPDGVFAKFNRRRFSSPSVSPLGQAQWRLP